MKRSGDIVEMVLGNLSEPSKLEVHSSNLNWTNKLRDLRWIERQHVDTPLDEL